MSPLFKAFQLTLLFAVLSSPVFASTEAPSLVQGSLNQVHSTLQRVQRLLFQQRQRVATEMMTSFSPAAQLTAALQTATTARMTTQAASEAVCRAAASNLNFVADECQLPRIVGFFLNPATVLNSTLSKFCASNCRERIAAQLNNVKQTCSGVVDLDSGLQGYHDALVVTKTACLQDGEGYFCMRSYRKLALWSGRFFNSTLDGEGVYLEDADCPESCVPAQFSLLTKYATSPIAGTMGFYKLMCERIEERYCAYDYQQVAAKRVPADTPSQLNAMCSPCFRRFYQGLYQIASLAPITSPSLTDPTTNSTTPVVVDNSTVISAESLLGDLNRLSYMCSKDGSGQFCLSRVENVPRNLSGCPTVVTTTPTDGQMECSATCGDQIRLLFEKTDCCINTIFQLESGSTAFDAGDNTVVAQWGQFAEQRCNITLPNSCAVNELTFSLTFQNVQTEWLKDPNHAATVTRALRRDLAARTGIPIAQIRISSLLPPTSDPSPNNNTGNNTTTPVAVSSPVVMRAVGEIIPQSEEDVQPTYARLSSAIAADDLDLAMLGAAVPLTARVDALLPLSLDLSASSVTIIDNSQGSLPTSPAARSASVAVVMVTGLTLCLSALQVLLF